MGHHARVRAWAVLALAVSCNDGDNAGARANRSPSLPPSSFVLSISHFREELSRLIPATLMRMMEELGCRQDISHARSLSALGFFVQCQKLSYGFDDCAMRHTDAENGIVVLMLVS